MHRLTPSRNAFADPALPSLAELMARVAADETLSLGTRQNWCWGLKVVARAAGQDPMQIPAHPEYLRSVWKKSGPGALGVSRAAWNNARSLAGKALQYGGLASIPGHYQAPFSPEWQVLWDRLPPGKNAVRMQLSRLLHYCSAQGIGPDQVDDAVLAAFEAALKTESIVENPYEIYRGAAKSWNNAAERVPGWPQQRVTVPSNQQTFCLPWHALPTGLLASVQHYLDRARGLDLLDEHFTRPLRPKTLKTREHQLRVLATAIVKSGIPVEPLTDLRALLIPERAAAGMQYLVDRNGGRSSVQISNIAGFLPTLARRLDIDEPGIALLKRMARKLKVQQGGMTDRNREALRAFDDPAAVAALIGLPQRILRDVFAGGRRGRREAKLVQSALAIEILLHAPVRIQNLASIEVDRHLVPVMARGQRGRHLRFPAQEVKNANDLEYPLPSDSVELLEIYLADWRSLLSSRSIFLFPGKDPRKHKGTGSLSEQIRDVVKTYTALDMPAHRFRHAAGKLFLDRNPGHYEVVRQLLGHKDIKTTVFFYAGAESASAARHYANTVLASRGGRPGLGDGHDRA
jgi:integrase